MFKNKEKFKVIYKAVAYTTLNVVLLLLLVNLCLGIYYHFSDKISSVKISTDLFPITDLDTAAFDGLPYKKITEINAAFNDMGRNGLYYQPWVEYSEPLFSSNTLNVVTDETGIPMRNNFNPENTDSLPVYTVYCFGGSTTFGYQVADTQTYPYYLRKVIADTLLALGKKVHIEVMNYGRGYYMPSEETQLLIDLIKLGHRPSLVLFMDGLNLGRMMDVPFTTETVVNRFYDIQFKADDISAKAEKKKLPMLRLAAELRDKYFPDTVQRIELNEEMKEEEAMFYLHRFLEDKKIATVICREYNIPCLFFSQPVAPYNYPEEFYRNYPFREDSSQRLGLRMFFDTLLKSDPEIISLHHLFGKWNRKAIVDYGHYSPAFSNFLAHEICSHINKEELLEHPFELNSHYATGRKREIAIRIQDLQKKNKVKGDALNIGN